MMVVARWHVLRGSTIVKRHGIDAVRVGASESWWRRGRVIGWDWDEVRVRRPSGRLRARLSVAGAVTVVVAAAVTFTEKSVGALGLEHAFRNVNGIFEAASGCRTEFWAHDPEPMRGRKAKSTIPSIGVRDEIRSSGFGGLRRRGVRRRGLVGGVWVVWRGGVDIWRGIGGGGSGSGVHGTDGERESWVWRRGVAREGD